MPRTLVLGANGQVGQALREVLPEAQFATRSDLDISDSAAIDGFDFRGIDLIINASAFTKVDDAETLAGGGLNWRVNALGPVLLAQKAASLGCRMVHYSSDYVFDGTLPEYSEDSDLNPISNYGIAKTAGDLAVLGLCRQSFVIRTSWVVGEGNNFVDTMISLAIKGISPKVVNDQFGRLTFADQIAEATKFLTESGSDYGVYNLTGAGKAVSWFDIARLIYARLGYDPCVVEGVTTTEYFANKEVVAPRPMNSVLSLSKIISAGFVPRYWTESLGDHIAKREGK